MLTRIDPFATGAGTSRVFIFHLCPSLLELTSRFRQRRRGYQRISITLRLFPPHVYAAFKRNVTEVGTNGGLRPVARFRYKTMRRGKAFGMDCFSQWWYRDSVNLAWAPVSHPAIQAIRNLDYTYGSWCLSSQQPPKMRLTNYMKASCIRFR